MSSEAYILPQAFVHGHFLCRGGCFAGLRPISFGPSDSDGRVKQRSFGYAAATCELCQYEGDAVFFARNEYAVEAPRSDHL